MYQGDKVNGENFERKLYWFKLLKLKFFWFVVCVLRFVIRFGILYAFLNWVLQRGVDQIQGG